MYEKIDPAVLEYAEDGTPFSRQFDDVYHTQHGALGQSRHVFLEGNQLPHRWQRKSRFVILETGFGLGLNFLATWAAWRDDPKRCDRLHFISIEKHPFNATDLATAHQRWPEFAALSARLRTQWPTLTPGIHRLWLDDGRIALTLIFGDASTALAKLVARVDAFYLDGFSPARNPELWSEKICHQLAALAAPVATLATWSVSREVRQHLEYARFRIDKVRGFTGKSEMLRGHIAGAPERPPAHPSREAIIVGAGLAGTSLAHRLVKRGWSVQLLDAANGPGQGASGNLAGVLRPLPSLDDNRLARLTRAGTLAGIRHLNALAAAGHAVRWAPTGVLHLARDPVHETRQRDVVDSQRPPDDYLRYVDQAEASALADWPLATGGWWFPCSGWVQPPSLCAANIAAAGTALTVRYGTSVARLTRVAEYWQLHDANDALISETACVILANGADIRHLDVAQTLPVRAARGQVSHLPATEGSAPKVVVCRLGYVSPAIDGQRCAGATFLVDDDDPALRESEHADNLAKLDFILPGFSTTLDDTTMAGRVGFRPASPDRLPMIGAIAIPGSYPADATLEQVVREPGLYAISGFGARGLVWSTIVAETLASQLDGDPLPLERDLVDAIDPGRFVLRRARRDRIPSDG
ncbi:bifunctional tRNA (5-methylaminomethyl-2-thiouridine)(34)-methyltransferase MnmD/FAD-dependent 5-carboxymethylaminomethyl-2-thiouridine(34) oxidoreductase MnmC [Denitromonas halophila]|uniref:tRNA 5-methylaminomethyl-2-thiouridine biosynthesis bifunctional protein MnmC n=1 Tax=Denitromonas halophila TaxID=1629404 RepID=A0A557QKI5_9RHOO|nr:bifunctional tRNA (5-methylaminomethyl-2-thiouridine)(34)-methyltransferase MnmD/FAD-dependent 5-carboxymethylaminomethyl-2-thiouridine(34) oxidoreductase MnmC [Denitromonas halophila]TVO53387.1 bifunctional tRNA (5-methylaminomethyl-2-thiouridine)(34)-methyltransferase MnmD/FAD-dependent 5-carboxymethylaminomethyl-2-thiouridine(34) oxidoreductase MnmC [Denitromonas halophila]